MSDEVLSLEEIVQRRRELDVELQALRSHVDVDALWDRYHELEAMRVQIDFELVTVESALRDVGAWSRPGRRRKVSTHTPDEAKEAHRRWKAGERSEWIEAGHRQYERENKRNLRKMRNMAQ